jgi:hypothetical protein
MRYMSILALIIFLVMCVVGGFASPDLASTYHPGFWMGVLHGYIFWWAFLLSLFKSDVTMYAAIHNGHWYDWGILCGIGLNAASVWARRDG